MSDAPPDRNATRCAIAIMAKAPRPGHSKTRLCPPLAPEQAARLSAAFLSDMAGIVQRAAEQAPIDLVVAYAPAGREAELAAHLPSQASLLEATGELVTDAGVVGFGRALVQAMSGLLARGYGAACLLNSDSPTLPPALLAQAAGTLLARPGTGVLGPSDDGGYYLLGLTREAPGLFRDIAWSTAEVAAQTRERAAASCIPLAELPVWYDVDDAASLSRLCRAIDAGADAPFSRAALEAMAVRTLLGATV
jgi:rSAM/selenodomain-associated transferase 1